MAVGLSYPCIKLTLRDRERTMRLAGWDANTLT
jgi:hypothetical protein